MATSPSRSRSLSRDRSGKDRRRTNGDGKSRGGRSRRHDENGGGDNKRGKEEKETVKKRRDTDGDKAKKDGTDGGDDDGNKGEDKERRGDGKRGHERSSKSRRHKKSSRHRSSSRRSKKRSRRSSSSDSSSSSSSGSSSSSSSSSSDDDRKKSKRRSKNKKSSSKKGGQPSSKHPPPSNVQVNANLLSKLADRNETLEEREERRAKRRAARITARFGYTAEDNPFRDPNLHETFTWKKKDEHDVKQKGGEIAVEAVEDGAATAGAGGKSRRDQQEHTFSEIEKVRQRREARELHLEEMERIRAEESRMKELENYDEWARKEEEFHLQQQRQRSAIRLVEGREKPVDVLAQNMLLFGLSEEEKENRAKVKYREKYSALEELETLETNLEEPYSLLKDLKLGELEELLVDVDAFRRLEREAAEGGGGERGGDAQGDNAVIRYWDALHTVTLDEIQFLKTGGDGGGHASLVGDIRGMFKGQSMDALVEMKADIDQKLRGGGDGGGSASAARFDDNGVVDSDYWQTVLDQLKVHLAKMELSEIHSKMLVRQLEKLETKREELHKKAMSGEVTADGEAKETAASKDGNVAASAMPLPQGVEPDFGNLEEELGLNDEIDLQITNPDGSKQQLVYAWQDKYRPRKPRYFNRVKTGYDWNAYNKTHYDHDNPPPKTVQGYKFNIFYPDLIDKTTTPQYFLERADTEDFCILRFSAGPPYEDVAFKIINRQWNKSRKRGFRCTFERGVLSLYYNFASHWYRR